MDIRATLYLSLLIENTKPANKRPIIFPKATTAAEISRECNKEFLKSNVVITLAYVSNPTNFQIGCIIDQSVKE